MPPSPSLRRSPGQESRGDIHKRGCSLESGLSFKERDDDLALFNEMQTKETENFLLQPSDAFEDILPSRAKPLPDLKLGINILARGESSDLLNVDGDKNDYDWLLTPPETPLFPSLDEEPEPLHGDRNRSRPISISRSSTMDRSHRSSRGSQSPQRLSPSPRSGNSTFRGRSSSAPQVSPVHLRPTTPSRRPSSPPVKSSTTPPRSSTPISQRTSAGSGVTRGIRGASPARTNPVNYASPKIKAWQSNIPGFSLEAPPNLRTSLADRPASYVRGSSPASRTSRDSPSRPRRQSMSPTPRSVSSSHSQERDRLSSNSKGSVASVGDDDADSLHSVPLSVSDRPMSRRGTGGFPNGRPVAFSKKATKQYPPSSAPKRSFDSAVRQMDRRSPQNMFRPLLSSVPSSTFYAGKTTAAHRTMISNSSVTTSSNASSDQATSGAHDTEGSDHYQDDMTSDCAKVPFSDIQDEVFAFDKMDVPIGDTEPRTHDPLSEIELGKPDENYEFTSNPSDPKESDVHTLPIGLTSEAVNSCSDFIENESHDKPLLCSICGCQYLADELDESEISICPECKTKEVNLTNPASVPLMNTSKEPNVVDMDTADPMNIPETSLNEENALEAEVHNSLCKQSCSEESPTMLVREESSRTLLEKQVTGEHKIAINDNVGDKSDANINATECAGISVLLLKRSSSVKGPLIHSRTYNNSAISYDDLSYARDLNSSMRSSTGYGSMSTSSSIDLGSVKHGGMPMQRQLIRRKSFDTCSKPHSTVSSLSGTAVQAYQNFGASTSSHEEEGFGSNNRQVVVGEISSSPTDQITAPQNAELHDAVPPFSTAALSEEDNRDVCMSSGEKDVCVMANSMKNNELDNSQAFLRIESVDGGDLQNNAGIVQNGENQGFVESSLAEETTIADNVDDEMEVVEDNLRHSLATVSEIEIEDSHPSSPRSQIDMVSREDVEDHSADKDVKGSSIQMIESEPTDEIVAESTVMVKDTEGRRTRSMTLEEATDTILFCSSIIHDLAYDAATIAIDKEKENLEPLEVFRPTVTIPEKQSFNRKNPPGRTTKAQKARKRHSETEVKPPLTNNEERSNDEKSNEPMVRSVGLPNNGDTTKPLKVESKCNCTIM